MPEEGQHVCLRSQVSLVCVCVRVQCSMYAHVYECCLKRVCSFFKQVQTSRMHWKATSISTVVY